jgi:hypothetical protein
MAKFTLEFLPHLAGGLKRYADFSLYEVKWNNYGKWGHFEFQINEPTQVRLNRTIETDCNKHILMSDFSVSDASNHWDEKRLSLYEKYKGQVLSKLPDGIYSSPEEWLLLRLILSYSKNDRLAISKMLNFRYGNHVSKELIDAFENDTAISNALQKYSGHIEIE